MSDTPTPTRITAVHTVSVPTTDQDRALEFYVGVLGFETRLDVPFGDGQRWIEVAPEGASTTVALAPAHGGVPTGVDTGIRLASADVDADHRALRARGIDVDQEILRLGAGVPPMFTFRDADGNNLFVVEVS
jgi:catechol 2,3-dioxygenase-like lactoylglutathione lyase family enzyme